MNDVAAQEVRPAVGQLLQVAEGELPDLALVALVDQRQPVAAPLLHVAVHAEVGDVERLALEVAEFPLGDVPGHVAPELLVVELASDSFLLLTGIRD